MPTARYLTAALTPALALAQTWHELPTTVPTTAVTWDSSRHRLLLAGVDSQQRIYEWDGTAARERLGELAGQKTVQHLLYDHAAGAVIALSTDRWVGAWTGGAWSWQNGGTAPPADVESSVAFDALRRRLVVVTAGDVHEWDGQRWWSIGAFGVSAGTAMAYDPISQRCIAYGGGSLPAARTWSWDGFSWTQVPNAGQPGLRGRASLALDPGTGLLALYGGSATATDTWLWNGASWLPLTTTSDPGPQTRAHLVGDDQGVLLLPLEGPDAGEIWRLRNGTWTEVDFLPPPPQGRTRVAFAYDFARGVLVALGGDVGGFPPPVEQTLLFDRRWLRAQPATNPPWRSTAHAAWSDPEQMVLAFGGQQNGVALGDTWSWTGTDWLARQPGQSPSPRWAAVMAPDPAGGVMLFGGRDATTYFGDHWHWNGTDWQPRAPATLPAARAASVHAHDPVRQQVVIFGGHSLAGVYATETWVWDGTDWAQQATAIAPAGATTAAFRPASGRVLAVGQSAAFEWSGTDWLAPPVPGHGVQQGTSSVPQLATHFGRDDLLLFRTPQVQKLVDVFAAAETYGSSCAIGPAPALAAIDEPSPGVTFAIELTARAGSAPALLAIGFQAQSVPVGSGCRALVGQQIGAWFAAANAGGIARFPFALPNDPTLRGVQFTAQGAVWNPAASPLGSATLTRGMKVTIGG